ncbi:zinc finger, C2H2 type [Onchocerca flexuosa]|uniref:Zinc finger, C2H2 type n=1 Tax=Onchocerca flexuosa TaxID=387005 RepID=A0A238BZ15_9BILA|nr:zinc finger, C2H2 type [Onchocerca flexuosa]
MITLDDESTANNCKVTENELHTSAGIDVDSSLQSSLKNAQNNSISSDNSKNYLDKSIEAIRNGIWASEKAVDNEEQHQHDRSNGDCTRPTFSGENGYVNSIDKKDCKGLDMIEKDIVIENDLCGNKGNGKTPLFTGCSTNKSTAVECIELDDDHDEPDPGSEPPAKKKKAKSPVPDDPDTQAGEKKPELTSGEALLNKLEAYVKDAIDKNSNVERKVLDALLGAINIQVQREPLSVRKLILDKQLVLPNTISFPPSQVVDLLIEHDPDAPLSKVIGRMFGDERPKLSEAEKRERHLLKLGHPAPHMTKLLMDIGQDLVQESTYSDIVHAKNLPETPKNMETYKQVAQQLKPVWEALRKKNEPYKLKQYTCQLCNFRTESRIILSVHRQTPHFDGRKYQCALCPEFFTNENMISQHYLREHDLIAGKEEAIPRNPCPCCNEDFMYKGQRDQHLKMCRRDLNRVRLIMAPKHPQDVSAINHWLWDKPPVDPTILQQQQVAQRQQVEKLQRAQLAQQQQQQLQQRRSQTAVTNSALLVAQQQQAALLLQQQRIRAAQAVAHHQQQAKMSSLIGNPSLLAAMQQQLQRAAVSGMRTPGLSLFAQRGVAAGIRGPTVAQHAAASLAGRIRAPPQVYYFFFFCTFRKHLKVPTSRTQLGGTISSGHNNNVCEICDQNVQDRDRYLTHLQLFHKQMRGKTSADMQQGAPLACSRCRDRFWTYEGLERHLVMAHGLVTSDLLTKAQKKEDGGRCKHCGKQYAFNMLQHLVTDHQVKLCSAEIMYSCDVCAFKCSSYSKLEVHLNTVHPKNPAQNSALSNTTSSASGNFNVFTFQSKEGLTFWVVDCSGQKERRW